MAGKWAAHRPERVSCTLNGQSICYPDAWNRRGLKDLLAAVPAVDFPCAVGSLGAERIPNTILRVPKLNKSYSTVYHLLIMKAPMVACQGSTG